MINKEFWEMADRLVKNHEIIIDRPKHSRHSRYPEAVYVVDYGYLQGTLSMDGEGIDIWVGTLPEKKITAIAVTIDEEKQDSEIKLLYACTEAEIQAIDRFQNIGSRKGIIIRNEQKIN